MEIGWVTGKGNIDKGSGWEDKVAAVVIVAVVAYVSAFTMNTDQPRQREFDRLRSQVPYF